MKKKMWLTEDDKVKTTANMQVEEYIVAFDDKLYYY